MIKSIEFEDYKIFKDTKFSDCKKYNLIFGYNATGKSTLTKLLKELEYNPSLLSNEKYKIVTDGSIPLNIKVYHGANYIEDNITKEDDNFVFFNIGKNSKELKNKEKIISEELKFFKKSCDSIENPDIDKKYREIASHATKVLSLQTQSFNINHVKEKYKSDILFTKISETEYSSALNKAISKEIKSKIDIMNK